MTYRFIDIPHHVPPEQYEITISKLVELIQRETAVISIYRLGNVNHPGISDIDLLVVFKNGSKCSLNVIEHLNQEDKYLLTHSLFGISEQRFEELVHYGFWDNLKCIYGTTHEFKVAPFSDEQKAYYHTQIALEFMFKNYIDLSTQIKYGAIKLRSIIQEIKGVRYDLEFLSIEGKPINQLMQQFLNRLDHWFENPFEAKEFSLWLDQYFNALQGSLIDAINQGKKMWVPQNNLHYGRNVKLTSRPSLKLYTSGIFLPPMFFAHNRKLFNAHQRLNQFEVSFPFFHEDPNGWHQERFKKFKHYKLENQQNYPHFGSLMSSLLYQFI